MDFLPVFPSLPWSVADQLEQLNSSQQTCAAAAAPASGYSIFVNWPYDWRFLQLHSKTFLLLLHPSGHSFIWYPVLVIPLPGEREGRGGGDECDFRFWTSFLRILHPLSRGIISVVFNNNCKPIDLVEPRYASVIFDMNECPVQWVPLLSMDDNLTLLVIIFMPLEA